MVSRRHARRAKKATKTRANEVWRVFYLVPERPTQEQQDFLINAMARDAWVCPWMSHIAIDLGPYPEVRR